MKSVLLCITVLLLSCSLNAQDTLPSRHAIFLGVAGQNLFLSANYELRVGGSTHRFTSVKVGAGSFLVGHNASVGVLFNSRKPGAHAASAK